MKIGLGTVQFGMNYGISNTRGKPSEDEIRRTLDVARGAGIQIIDTAHTYGESEAVLGRNLPAKHEFRIVTKTLPLRTETVSAADIQRVISAFHFSLERLRQPSVYGLLAHHASDLLAKGGEHLMSTLVSLKSQGLIKKIGVSVYDQLELDAILSRYTIDMIQLPFNVLDQRLLENGTLSRLNKDGIEIHARSIFLQGLLLMDPDNLGSHFRSAQGPLKKFHEFSRSHGKTPLELALNFAINRKEIDHIIIGINHPEELAEILSAAQLPPAIDNYSDFAIHDETVLNPARWPH
ncbi:MAG: aldo/keto reductase [Burkholderiales bacterium]|nr:aldo/keto reductase [Burkholderiales bacterium]MDP2399074.1 aldo/keto reductase [Burkholderiales bacterium]MDP3716036.1 aldo/keto reductase [Burkholderiales bacterium]